MEGIIWILISFFCHFNTCHRFILYITSLLSTIPEYNVHIYNVWQDSIENYPQFDYCLSACQFSLTRSCSIPPPLSIRMHPYRSGDSRAEELLMLSISGATDCPPLKRRGGPVRVINIDDCCRVAMDCLVYWCSETRSPQKAADPAER